MSASDRIRLYREYREYLEFKYRAAYESATKLAEVIKEAGESAYKKGILKPEYMLTDNEKAALKLYIPR